MWLMLQHNLGQNQLRRIMGECVLACGAELVTIKGRKIAVVNDDVLSASRDLTASPR